jgi:hypothetical protein
MSPSFQLPKELIHMTPEYQLGYQDAFNDAKRACLKRLKAIEREIENLEAFNTGTSTVDDV